jgi:hypothetical protein
MTKEQAIVKEVARLAIPEFLIGRASVVLMSREGPRPTLLKTLVDDARAHWKASGAVLDGHVNACILRASLTVAGREPLLN